MTRPNCSPSREGRSGSGPARLWRVAGVLFLGTTLSACATKRDVRDLGAEMRELQAQNQALIQLLQEEQEDQSDSLSALSRAVQENRGEMVRRMNGIEDQLLTIQELTGLGQQQLSQLRDEIERNRQANSFQGPGGGFPVDPDAGAETAEELFETGESQFRREAYSAARFAFEELIDRFPLDPTAGDARYYLGEIAYEEGEPEAAIDFMVQSAEIFPNGFSAATALYRAGQISVEIGEVDQAREYLEQVIESWPNSSAAPLAELQLDEL